MNNEFSFKTSKGNQVTLRIVDGKRCLSVGNYINVPYIDAGDNLRAMTHEGNVILVPVPENVKSGLYAWGDRAEIRGTVKCVECGNLKYDAEPKQYYCSYCDEPKFHKLVA